MRMAGCRPRNAVQVPPPEPHITGKDMRPAAPASGNVAMFEKRTNLVRFLAVAETGRIGAAAERSNVTQPTLTLPSRAGRFLTGRSCQWLPLGVGRRMSPQDSHRVALQFDALASWRARHSRRLRRLQCRTQCASTRTRPRDVQRSDGLKFRMATSGIRAGALLCRSGTAWVSDRIQTRVYRRRPLSGLEEHDAKNQEHSNDKRTLVTHTLDDGRSSQARSRRPSSPPRNPPSTDALGAKTSVANISSAEGTATTRPCPRPAPTRFGPPAIPDHCCRPTLGRRFGAVPGAGQRGARRDTGAQRTVSCPSHGSWWPFSIAGIRFIPARPVS